MPLASSERGGRRRREKKYVLFVLTDRAAEEAVCRDDRDLDRDISAVGARCAPQRRQYISLASRLSECVQVVTSLPVMTMTVSDSETPTGVVTQSHNGF
jgi:hypothetical protein